MADPTPSPNPKDLNQPAKRADRLATEADSGSHAPEANAYELDDGPLAPDQVKTIQAIADRQAFTGPTIRKSSLLPTHREKSPSPKIEHQAQQ